MLSLAYSISGELKDKLVTADSLRARILTTPLLPKSEIKLRWEMLLQRLYGSLSLAGNPLSKNQVASVLMKHPQKIHPEEREMMAYKLALDHLSQNWTGNPKPVTTGSIAEIVGIVARGTKESALRQFRLEENKVKQLLDYLQTQGDHPVVQSAIAHYHLVAGPPFSDDRGRTARLIGYLFLTKFGYDVRGLVAPERVWRETEDSYRRAQEVSATHGQLTPFLEYIVGSFIASLEETLRDLAGSRFHSEQPTSFWELNDRQKTILSQLENPEETSITNRKVQKLFKISQITASRDLTKLAILSLVYAHGKGRSVYYTRA